MGQLRIKEWPEEDRPREKLLLHGPEILTDSELLAVLVRTGVQGKSAVALARDLLAAHASLSGIARRPVGELTRLPGMGPARTAAFLAACEIGRRISARGNDVDAVIRSPEDVAHRYIPLMRDLPAERFVVVLLNNAGRILRDHIVSIGSVNASIVHPREVFRHAVAELASSIILLHNHPSGVREASKEDHAVTRQLVEAGRMMDIPVRDHVIICGNAYVSFAEQGWL